ncbi:MAG: hypothetical protein HY367_00640 [Candidatus Aenigmarchaeota archaeon]|nr:hypothetical protein [Candidatus Aenigmarchaeota archaeon]
MRKIYVIGTLHNMMPRHKKELIGILERMNPDQVLVEIAWSDLKAGKLAKYPKEMAVAYMWAVRKHKKAGGFDSKINIIKKSVTQRKAKEIEKKMFRRVRKLGWKELNKARHEHILDDLYDLLVDTRKHTMREREMLKNIRRLAGKEGRILIVTGAGHLPFFEKNLKGAVFPFRRKP